MIVSLNISSSCVIKEFEMMQEDIQAKMQSDPTYSDLRTRQFIQAIDQLGIRRRCICRDPSCSQWDAGACRCNGNPYCRNLSYEFRYTEFIPSTNEKDLATRQIPAENLRRLSDEPFIVWKARTESLIWSIAKQIHNTPEAGKTDYIFSSGATTPEVRTRQFQAYVRDVRTLGRTSATLDHTQAVGCSVCERVYMTRQNLLDHVDRYRAQGDLSHLTATEITSTLVIPVRATSSDYRLSIPTVTISPAIPHSVLAIAIHHRDNDQNDEEWNVELRRLVRGDRRTFPNAIGCIVDGEVYRNGDEFHAHVHAEHDDLIDRDDAITSWGISGYE